MSTQYQLSGSVNVSVNSALAFSFEEAPGVESDSLSKIFSAVLSEGNGHSEMNRIHHTRLTLQYGVEQVLDLRSLNSPLGGPYKVDPYWTTVKAVMLHNRSTAVDVWINTVGSANNWKGIFGGTVDGRLQVRRGGMILVVAPDTAGMAIGASAYNLRVSHGGVSGDPTADIDIVLFGAGSQLA